MALSKSHEVCVNLRTRSNYLPAFQQAELNYNPDDYTPCQCLKTLHVIGPDDRPVTPEDCVAGRRCFEGLSAVVA
ncbi:hypothetical protein HUU05_25980 [candidate division KSB1 bacterium]|nr:hypothetical protein [candidate division KSB1 bacterium]